MEENTSINFAEVFSNEAMTSLKNLILLCLEKQYNGAQNAVMEYTDKTVYLHAHKGNVELHIVDSDRPAPELPSDEDEQE